MFFAAQTTYGQDREKTGDPAKVDTTKFPEVPLPPQRPTEFDVPLYRDYDSQDELKEWAYNTSRFGGSVRTIQLSGREIHYSVRTFTGGYSTYEIIFLALFHFRRTA